jgi:DNA-binding CsgD family transcriptional regulator
VPGLEILTLKEVADLLRVAEKTIYTHRELMTIAAQALVI